MIHLIIRLCKKTEPENVVIQCMYVQRKGLEIQSRADLEAGQICAGDGF